MSKIVNIALNDLRVMFADRGMWIQIVVIPIVIAFFIGLANGGFGAGEPAPTLVDVFDNDGGELATQFLNDLRATGSNLILCPMDNKDDSCKLGEGQLTEENAQTRLNDNVTGEIIEIPAGFSTQALAGNQTQIVYRSKETLGQTSPVLSAVQAVTQRVTGAVVAARVGVDAFKSPGAGFKFADDADQAAFEKAVYDRATTIWAGLPPAVNYSESARKQTSGFSQSIPGIATMYVMANVMIGAIILITERKQWTLQRLIMMPISRGEVIGGKMLGRFVTGMIQYAILFAFGFMLGVRYGNSPLAILLVMVVFTLCSTAIALLLATFVTTEQQAGVALNLVILTLAPLGGAWWPLEIMPQWMQTIGHISPIAWAMEGFRAVIFHGGGLQDVIAPSLVLLAITGVCFAIAIRRFKYE
jgi:linearmycin/streptolysin S transport system permease protein